MSIVTVTLSQGIGISLAILGNLGISVGLTLQKQVHNNNVGENKVPYMKLPKWWAGLCLVVLGETGNFLAYGYASATVVAPLGSVSVVSNAFLSHLYLKEPVRCKEVVGLGLAILGSVIVVLEAPHEESALTMEELTKLVQHAPFITFIVIVVVAFIAIAVGVPKHMMERYVIGYLMLCALSGSITVMCTKGISSSLVLTWQGHNQFKSPVVYILIVTAAFSIFWNIRYLNMAMSRFGASTVVPVYYVLFTFFAIAAGMVLISEQMMAGATAATYSVFGFGIVITFVGVYLITISAQQQNAAYEEMDEDVELKGSNLNPVPEDREVPAAVAAIHAPVVAPSHLALQHVNTGRESGSERSSASSSPKSRRASLDYAVPIGTPMLGALSFDLARRWSLGQEGTVLSPPAESPYRKSRPHSVTLAESLPIALAASLANDELEEGEPRPRSNSLPSSPRNMSD